MAQGLGDRPVLAQAAAFTLLNPHVYLDTVLLVGSIGAQQPAPLQVWFAAGASMASFLWFSALGFGAPYLAHAVHLKWQSWWQAQKNRFTAVFWDGLSDASLAWAFGTVEPVGQYEQAKNHEHDDEDVFDFHGFSLS